MSKHVNHLVHPDSSFVPQFAPKHRLFIKRDLIEFKRLSRATGSVVSDLGLIVETEIDDWVLIKSPAGTYLRPTSVVRLVTSALASSATAA